MPNIKHHTPEELFNARTHKLPNCDCIIPKGKTRGLALGYSALPLQGAGNLRQLACLISYGSFKRFNISTCSTHHCCNAEHLVSVDNKSDLISTVSVLDPKQFLKAHTKTINASECILPICANGKYIQFSPYQKKVFGVGRIHQLAYKLHFGYINKCTYAICETRYCCNPLHLVSNKRARTGLRTTKLKITKRVKIQRQEFWMMDRAGMIRWDVHATQPVQFIDNEPYIVRLV